MNETFQLIALCLTGGLASLIGAMIIIFLKGESNSVSQKLTSFAAGVLLSVGILDLLTEAYSMSVEPKTVSIFVLVGVLFVFMLEKSGLWFHHHDGDHGKHPPIAGIFVGDMMHNFIDGFAIGATFLVSKEAGIATAMAVALHELPKEMADFMIYLRSGFSNIKTIALNLTSSLVAVVGGLSVFYMGDFVGKNEANLLAATGGMFLFIALADLVPEMHEEMEKAGKKSKLGWLLTFALGIAVGVISSFMS
jgi:zinc and cadmium transporter